VAQVTAVGSGPVVFSADDGKQIQVPLTLIYFEDGAVGTSRTNDASSANLLLWLRYLVRRGRIGPGASSPPKTALAFKATNPGASGNNITITAAEVVPATTPRRVDLTVALTDRYPNLRIVDLGHLDDLMGTAGAAGSKPGLLRVKTPLPGNPVLPTVGEKPEDDRTPVGGVTPPANWTLSGTGADALVLEPSTPGDAFDAGTTVVRVDAGAAADSVTLVVTWSATVRNVAATDDFATKLDPFRLLVKLGDPPAGGFTLPRPDTVSLTGGADSSDAVAATATLLTDS
jgi:hypothetical protein